MSAWASILLALVKLATSIADRLSEEQLKQVGKDETSLKNLEEAHARLRKALDARRASASDDGLRDSDGHRRD